MKGFSMMRMVLSVLLVSMLAIPEDVTAAATVEYIHTDALGSPVAVTNSNGVVIERREYEPYGRQLSPTPVADGPGYTGHVSDAATGLDYMQQRYYDSEIGRFLSVDPVAASLGLNFNRYSYAANNPYRFTDPDGRDCKSKDGTTTCTISITGTRIPQRISMQMPKSISFKTPSGLTGTQKSGSPLSHKYGYPAEHKKSDGSVQRSMVNDPTPAPNDIAATPQGTLNNATPGGLRGAAARTLGVLPGVDGDSPVRSFSATDDNGNTWAINVTEPGHGLHFGFVLRGSVGGVALTYGEGWSLAQAAGGLSDITINDVWIEQNQRNIDEAR